MSSEAHFGVGFVWDQQLQKKELKCRLLIKKQKMMSNIERKHLLRPQLGRLRIFCSWNYNNNLQLWCESLAKHQRERKRDQWRKKGEIASHIWNILSTTADLCLAVRRMFPLQWCADKTCSWHIAINFPISANLSSACMKTSTNLTKPPPSAWFLPPRDPSRSHPLSAPRLKLLHLHLLQSLTLTHQLSPLSLLFTPPGDFYVHKLAACQFPSGCCGQSKDNKHSAVDFSGN